MERQPMEQISGHYRRHRRQNYCSGKNKTRINIAQIIFAVYIARCSILDTTANKQRKENMSNFELFAPEVHSHHRRVKTFHQCTNCSRTFVESVGDPTDATVAGLEKYAKEEYAKKKYGTIPLDDTASMWQRGKRSIATSVIALKYNRGTVAGKAVRAEWGAMPEDERKKYPTVKFYLSGEEEKPTGDAPVPAVIPAPESTPVQEPEVSVQEPVSEPSSDEIPAFYNSRVARGMYDRAHHY